MSERSNEAETQPSRVGLGRGGAMLGFAKLWFLLASYAISIGLTHLLTPAVYGRYYVVSRLIAVPNMVLIYTVLFAVSRPMAAEYEAGIPHYAALRRRGLKLALSLGGLTALVFAAGASAIATWMHDEDLIAPLLVVAPISLLYAVYAVNLGSLNAQRCFSRQATLDVFMVTSKAALILGAAAAGASLVTTLGGFTLASGMALALSAWLLPKRVRGDTSSGSSDSARAMVHFVGGLIAFTAMVNLLQSADVLLLKHFATDDQRRAAVGFYSSAEQVALVPFSLMNAVSLLMFPLIAALDHTLERDKVRRYVGETAKLTLLLLTFMSAVGSACAPAVQALLFPQAYGAAAAELRLLVWGFSGYSFTVTTAWILNSSRRTPVAVRLVALPLVIVIAGCWWLAPQSFTLGAAKSVATAGAVGVVASLLALARHFGVTLPAVHIAKLVLAVAVVELVANVWPLGSTAGVEGKMMVLVRLAVLAIVFVVVAVTTGAFRIAAIRELRRGGS